MSGRLCACTRPHSHIQHPEHSITSHTTEHTHMDGGCPVCGLPLPPGADLEGHVQAHFADDDTSPGAAAGANAQHPIALDLDEDGEELVGCPFGCGARVTLDELESHEEAHRLQELEAQHMDTGSEQEAREFERLQMKFGFTDKRPGKCHRCGKEGHWARECPLNPAAPANRPRLSTIPAELALVQQADPAFDSPTRSGIDVIPLLQACIRAAPKPRSTVYLSGPVAFFCRSLADSGWGCGYRNIQMQVSHLLRRSEADRQALFAGAGYVPDIASLQAWLEASWHAGFDPGGAAMFGTSVQGSRKWIGTTEAAALLRSFGCRALIVDFHGPKQTAPGGATVHTGVECNLCSTSPITGVRHKSLSRADFDVCSDCVQQPQVEQQYGPFHESGQAGSGGAVASAPNGAAAGQGNQPKRQKQGPGQKQQHTAMQQRDNVSKHRALAEWVWNYFSSPGDTPAAAQNAAAGGSSGGGGRPAPPSRVPNAFDRLMAAQDDSSVVTTSKPPLYFQHEGHSRTIVGIERTLPPSQARSPGAAGPSSSGGSSKGDVEYTLLVLDPGQSSGELLGSLRNKHQWQMRVKRGLHSLARHAELQLLFVAPGLLAPQGPEWEALKKVSAAEKYTS